MKNPKDNTDSYSYDRTYLLMEYWKQSTQVQQHFNDVSMKVRNFAVVVFSGFITAVGISIHKEVYLDLWGVEVSAAVVFCIVGAFLTQLIHFMDTYWYHIFLKSAVSSTIELEKELKNNLNVRALADEISAGSQKVTVYSLFSLVDLPLGRININTSQNSDTDSNKTTLLGRIRRLILPEKAVDSSKRHKIFYRWLIFAILLTGFFSFFLPSPKGQDVPGNQITSSNPDVISYISGTNVRFRAYPSQSSKVLSLLSAGTQVTKLDLRDNNWVFLKVIMNGKPVVGYVKGDFVGQVSIMSQLDEEGQ